MDIYITFQCLGLTCGLGNGSNQHGGNGHQDASGGGNIGQQLGPSGCLAGEHPLEVDLPGNASKDEQQPVVYVKPMLFRLHVAYPIHLQVTQTAHVLVAPGKGNAHPQADEDAEQLDHIRIRHGVESAEECVEDGDARGQDHRGAMVHVDDHGEGGSQRG